MRKVFIDKAAVFLGKIIWPYARMKLHTAMNNIQYSKTDDINFKRRQPFLLLANHTFGLDAFAIGIVWRRLPIALVSRSLLTNRVNNFRIKFLARAIPKTQGERDMRAMKDAIRSIRRRRSLLVMPEGEVTYFGNPLPIGMDIARLAKKLGVDVITASCYGGYISNPRWAIHRRDNQFVKIHFDLLIKKENLNELPVEEIHRLIVSKISIRAFDWQREHMIKVGGQKRAEGLQEFLYICPECNAVHSIRTVDNDVICINCKTVGYYDEYGFIKGFSIDNTADWNEYQLSQVERLKESAFETRATFYNINYKKFKARPEGSVVLRYENSKLFIFGVKQYVIDIVDVKNFRLTQKNIVTFTYAGEHFFIKLDSKYESFNQVCK